jgi:predicted enzyme related to lactoylglutathione lyase
MPVRKICYLEIPATDVGSSAGHYSAVFGWKVRERGSGAPGAGADAFTTFRDPSGNVFGLFQEPRR